jgi:glycosyltransferase involved in cell wall biosynthesis
MDVSVIIPVYRAEAYVQEAVQSAVALPEAAEVLLIEDGSPDGSLAVCERLARNVPKVRLLRHPGGANRGAAASRNRGVTEAHCDYVAFLDADDYYLPHRFAGARTILEAEPAVDGVCETMGTHFMSEDARRQWAGMGYPLLTGLRPGLAPERIFEEQAPLGQGGHCHVNAVTLRRRVFARCGGFPDLVLVEDTAFFMKLAACATLRVAPAIEPVAMRRVHAHNRVTAVTEQNRRWKDRRDVCLSVLKWMHSAQPPCFRVRARLVLNRMLWDMRTMMPSNCTRWGRQTLLMSRLVGISVRFPALSSQGAFIRAAALCIQNRP